MKRLLSNACVIACAGLLASCAGGARMHYEARAPQGQLLAVGEIKATLPEKPGESFRGIKNIRWAPGSEKLRTTFRVGPHSGTGPVAGTFGKDSLRMDLNAGMVDHNVILTLKTTDGLHYTGRWIFAGYAVGDGGPCSVTLQR